MPIDVEIWHGEVGLTENCHGKLVGKDFLDINNHLMSSPELLTSLRCALIDLECVDSSGLTSSEIRQVAAQNKQMMPLLPPGVILAFVVSNDLPYGLVRMWEAFVADTGWEVMVLRTKSDAMAWIRQRMKEKFEIDLRNE